MASLARLDQGAIGYAQERPNKARIAQIQAARSGARPVRDGSITLPHSRMRKTIPMMKRRGTSTITMNPAAVPCFGGEQHSLGVAGSELGLGFVHLPAGLARTFLRQRHPASTRGGSNFVAWIALPTATSAKNREFA